jgi:hypothetical protein
MPIIDLNALTGGGIVLDNEVDGAGSAPSTTTPDAVTTALIDLIGSSCHDIGMATDSLVGVMLTKMAMALVQRLFPGIEGDTRSVQIAQTFQLE